MLEAKIAAAGTLEKLLDSILTHLFFLSSYQRTDLLNLVYEAKSELSFLVGLSFFHVVFVTRHVDCFVIYESDAQKNSDHIPDYDMELMGIKFQL